MLKWQESHGFRDTLGPEGQFERAQMLSTRAVASWERCALPVCPAFAVVLARHATSRSLGASSSRRVSTTGALLRSPTAWLDSRILITLRFRPAWRLRWRNLVSRVRPARIRAPGRSDRRQHLRLTLRSLPERQVGSRYAARRPRGLDLAMSLSATSGWPSGQVFEALIKTRGLVLDEMAARRRASSDSSRPDVAPLWTALTAARQRLANLVVRGPNDQQPQQYVTLVENARREKELAERA